MLPSIGSILLLRHLLLSGYEYLKEEPSTYSKQCKLSIIAEWPYQVTLVKFIYSEKATKYMKFTINFEHRFTNVQHTECNTIMFMFLFRKIFFVLVDPRTNILNLLQILPWGAPSIYIPHNSLVWYFNILIILISLCHWPS